MTRDEATALIRPAVAGRTGDRADLGAGSGTFTAALAHLWGAPHTATAVERDVAVLAELRQLATSLPRTAAAVHVPAADLAEPAALDVGAAGSLMDAVGAFGAIRCEAPLDKPHGSVYFRGKP